MTNVEYKWDLKLKSGKWVTWNGRTATEAAERYVDCHREDVVVAYREANYGIGVFAGVNPRQISC